MHKKKLEDLEKEMCELRHALKDHAIAIRDIGTMSVLTRSAQRFQMSMKFSGDSRGKEREFTVCGGSYLYLPSMALASLRMQQVDNIMESLNASSDDDALAQYRPR